MKLENSVHVVLKLVTGETLMATYDGEDDRFIMVEKPVQIKTILIPELERETVTAAPYCPFSESTTFILEKTHIVYIKRLHKVYIAHYNKFMKVYDEAFIPVETDLEESENNEVVKTVVMGNKTKH